jgi:hypothetical protein
MRGGGLTLLSAICRDELLKQVGGLVVFQWCLPIDDDMSCRSYSLDDMSQSSQHRRMQRDLFLQKRGHPPGSSMDTYELVSPGDGKAKWTLIISFPRHSENFGVLLPDLLSAVGRHEEIEIPGRMCHWTAGTLGGFLSDQEIRDSPHGDPPSRRTQAPQFT